MLQSLFGCETLLRVANSEIVYERKALLTYLFLPIVVYTLLHLNHILIVLVLGFFSDVTEQIHHYLANIFYIAGQIEQDWAVYTISDCFGDIFTILRGAAMVALVFAAITLLHSQMLMLGQSVDAGIFKAGQEDVLASQLNCVDSEITMLYVIFMHYLRCFEQLFDDILHCGLFHACLSFICDRLTQ